jgi:dTDP-4-dehydrorhamnose reductase
MDDSSTLVLGSRGFLGSYFSKALPGASVYSRKNKIHASLPSSIDSPDDLLAVIDFYNPTLVINCLALADLELCEANVELAFWMNSEIPHFLASYSRIKDYKLIHFSTDAVFRDSDETRDENVKNDPTSIYAKSKLQGEIGVLSQNSNHLVCRTNFFGVDTLGKNIFSFFASKFDSGCEVNGYSDSYFNPVYVEDLVAITLELNALNRSGLYHIAGDTKLSKAEFAQRVAREMNLGADLVKVVDSLSDSRWKIRTKDLYMDNTKLREAGISPKSLDAGISQAVKVWMAVKRSERT